jgi:hypothetical protein
METCKRVVFPLPLHPNIKPKLQKKNRVSKEIEATRKKYIFQDKQVTFSPEERG